MKVGIQTNAGQFSAQLDRAMPSIMRHVDAQLGRGAQEVAREEKRLAPKAHSLLTNAIRVERNGVADYSVIAGVQHAVYPERGTGPGGMPQHQTLVDWIRVKGITPRDPDMDEDDLAFVIGRSIRARGTPAQPYAAPALAAKRDRLGQLVRLGVAEGLKEIGRE